MRRNIGSVLRVVHFSQRRGAALRGGNIRHNRHRGCACRKLQNDLILRGEIGVVSQGCGG